MGHALRRNGLPGNGSGLGGGALTGISLGGYGDGQGLPGSSLRRHALSGHALRLGQLSGQGHCLPGNALYGAQLRGHPLPGSPLSRCRLSRNCLPRNPLTRNRHGLPGRDGHTLHTRSLGSTLRRSHLPGNSRRPGGGGRIELARRLPSPSTPAGRLQRMRLGRRVIVGRVVRRHVVAPVVGLGGSVSERCLTESRLTHRCLGEGCLAVSFGLLGGVLRRAVRLGRREREHRARPRLLRCRTLGRGGQRTPTPSRRLRRATTGVRGGTRVRSGRRRRGQGRGQRLPFAVPSRSPSTGGHGHALRRHGLPEPRGSGTGGVLGGGHDRALGDAVALGRTGPPSSPPGPAGTLGAALVGRGLSGKRELSPAPATAFATVPGSAPAPPGGHGRLRRGTDLALQEGVDGSPTGPPSPPALRRGLLGQRDRGTDAATVRSRTRTHTGVRTRTRTRTQGQSRTGVRTGSRNSPGPAPDRHLKDERAAAHPGNLVRLQHSAVRAHDAPHDRLVHRVSPVYGPRTSIRTTSPRCAAATTTVLSM